MKGKTLLLLSATFMGAVLILASLLFLTKMPNKENNGFKRQWLINPILKDKVPLTLPIEKICGATENNIFLTIPNPQW